MAGGAARHGDPRTVLEAEIRRRDQTYDEVTAAFIAKARALRESATISSRHLRRLASGERVGTNPATRRVLAALFDRPAADLLSAWAPQPIENRSGLAVPQAASERQLIELAAERARKFTIFSQAALPEGSLDQVFDDVRRLSTEYPQRPLSAIIGDLVDVQDTLFTLLEQRNRPAEARSLYLLAGVVGGLLAKVSHDMADPYAANTQARAAFLAAENADHDGLRAWIRGLQSLVAYWAGRHRDAVTYAQQGQQYGSTGTVSVWLPVSEARAWAALGNVTEARRAVQASEDQWTTATGDELDELGGLCRFSRARHAYYAADAFAWLPSEATAAAAYAEEAVSAYQDTSSPDWAFGDQAGSHADLAIARIAQGQLAGAEAAIAPVLDLPVPQRINGIIRSVRHVDDALQRAGLSDDPATIDLRDQINTFTRTPLAALPC